MKITVTKEFKAAFKKCMDHWEVTGDELEYEKQRVRDNYADAEKCYLSVCKELK